MVQQENTSVEDMSEGENLEKKGSQIKNKIYIFIIGIIFFVVVFTGYAYYSGTKSTEKKASVIEKIQTGIKKTVQNKNNDINYSFFADGNIEIVSNGEIVQLGDMSIVDGKVLSTNNGLKQRIQLASVDAKYEDETFSIKNLDLISDNEKVYLFLEEGLNYYADILESLQIPEQNTSDLNSVISSGNYVSIDNSKPLLAIFGDLVDNELIKELIIGSVTSNPGAYYKSNGTDKKIEEYLSTDKILDYLFVEGETNTVTNKTSLLLNTQICKDYSPIVANILKNISGTESPDFDSQSNEELVSICEEQIQSLNIYLPLVIEISKEGDIKNGNYTFAINQGNLLNIELIYVNHILESGYVNFQDPTQQFSFTFQGDSKNNFTSVININMDVSGGKISGTITDGTGNITIQGEVEDLYLLNGTIGFKNYIVSDYDIMGNMDDFGTAINFSAKGNLRKGNVKFIAKEGEEEIVKFILDYTGLNHNLEYMFDSVKGTSILQDDLYKLSYEAESQYIGKTELGLNYDSGKITGFYKDEYDDIQLQGNFNGINDFQLSLIDDISPKTINILGTGDIKSELKYTFESLNETEKELELVFDINKEKINGNTVYNMSVNGGFLDNNILNDGVKFNFTIGFKEGEVEYMIPENIGNIDINILEIITLPNISSLTPSNLSKQRYMLAGITGGAVIGTVGYISLTGYSQDAKNTKVISDISTLAKMIETSLIMGRVTMKDIVIPSTTSEYEASSVIVNSQTIRAGEGYNVGTINFEALWQNGDEFIQPDGSEYIIGVVATGSIAQYQIMGIINENGYEKSIVKGNFYQSNSDDSEGLIFIGNKALINNEYIY